MSSPVAEQEDMKREKTKGSWSDKEGTYGVT